MNQFIRILILALSIATLSEHSLAAEAEDGPRRIPDEYEAVGGHALALGNAGVAAIGGTSAVRLNPALMPLEPQYSIGLGYNWPTEGRDFYQGAVVDSSTASVAAGIMATGFQDPYEENRERTVVDAHTDKRVALALARAFKRVSLGINGQWVSGSYRDAGVLRQKRGATAGVGVAGLLTERIRLGASAENLSNRQVAEFAPRTLRAGVAFMMGGGNVTAHLDYRQRQRIEEFERNVSQPVREDDKIYQSDEQMIIGSFSAKVYDVLRLLAAYGQSISDDKRRMAAGGIGLVHNAFSISYDVSQPYLNESALHTAVNLNIVMAM